MTEKTFNVLKKDDLGSYLSKFENEKIFEEIKIAAESKNESLEEIHEQIMGFLDRILLNNLYLEFKNNGSLNKLNDFIDKLTSQNSGVDQITSIDERLSSEKDIFWEKIKAELHELFLNDLLKRLKE